MFTLTIVTPTSNKTIKVNWIALETSTGNIMVKTGHSPLLVQLKPNHDLRFETKSGVTESMAIPGGFADVQRDKTTIIVDQ